MQPLDSVFKLVCYVNYDLCSAVGLKATAQPCIQILDANTRQPLSINPFLSN